MFKMNFYNYKINLEIYLLKINGFSFWATPFTNQ